MKILIIGGSGMLGHKLVQGWSEKFDVWATIRNKFAVHKNHEIFNQNKLFQNVDVLQFDLVEKIINKLKAEVVINAVGIIKQLPISKDIINTLEINSVFPHKLNKLAETVGFRLINISTDCVFSGNKGNYVEEDIPDATDLYGKSKNLGEVVSENCLTIRTSIIGRELFTTHSLLEWFLTNEGKKVKGFKNAVFSGFPTVVLADILADLIINYRNLSGLFHLSSSPINKFDLLNLIKESFDLNVEIEPYEDFYIDRSLNSTKIRNIIGFEPLSWKKMIEIMAQDQKNYLKK
jgi:dTDP-4-dehydrorhamnose reductase